MPVRTPAGGFEIDFHISGARWFVAKLNDRPAEIRPAFATQKAGMKNSHVSTVQGSELLAHEALVSPDGLK
jgi:hypothetical protein